MFDDFWHTVGAVLTWITGEAGRVWIAGAAGGLLRWFHQEVRRIRDGVIAVISGVMAAQYLPPIVVPLLQLVNINVALDQSTAASIYFVSGLVGMSVTKLLLAVFEVYIPKLFRREGTGNE